MKAILPIRWLGWGLLAVLLVIAPTHASNEAAVLHSQTGQASWYGPDFHGKKTASGERFDMHDLVAAHPSLPLGSVARITNLSNGRKVDVNIIDRGPAKWVQRRGVVIDLSLGAAKKLGFVGKGKTRVKIDVIEMGG